MNCKKNFLNMSLVPRTHEAQKIDDASNGRWRRRNPKPRERKFHAK